MKASKERLLLGLKLLEKENLVKNKKIDIPKFTYPDVGKVNTFVTAIYNQNNKKIEVTFLETTFYQKIDHYEQRNGIKEKVLSKILTKEKEETINLATDKATLENLRSNENELIALNALKIIIALKNIYLTPTWAQEICFSKVHEYAINKNNEKANLKLNDVNLLFNDALKEKDNIENNLNNLKKEKEYLIKKEEKLIKKAINSGFIKNKVRKLFISLFIYDPLKIYYNSIRKLNKNNKKLKELNNKITECETNYHDSLINLNEKKYLKESIENEIAYINNLENYQYDLDLSNVYLPLKNFIYDNPKKKEIIKEEIIFNKEIKDENILLDNYIYLNDNKFKLLEGLKIAATFNLYDINNNILYTGFSFDLYKAINNLFIKKSSLFYKQNKDDFKINYNIVTNKEEMLASSHLKGTRLILR